MMKQGITCRVLRVVLSAIPTYLLQVRRCVFYFNSSTISFRAMTSLGRSSNQTKRTISDSDSTAMPFTKITRTQTSSTQKTKTRPNANTQLPILTETTADQPWYNYFTKGDKLYETYMATEWGYTHEGDDIAHFEALSLEGAQSGLSWRTILYKREAYRRTFHGFDPVKVSRMTPEDVQRIVSHDRVSSNECVVRHRGKILSVINNAACVLNIQKNKGRFADYLWSFVDHKPILNHIALPNHSTSLLSMPSTSQESVAMSHELKKHGFKFVGPTTCYSLMQALGLVIDHPVNTPEWKMARERLRARPGGFQERYQ